MKFRAKLTDAGYVKQLCGIVSSIAKLTKECVMRITPSCLHLLTIDENLLTKQPKAWYVIDHAHFFDYYKMEGVSSEQDENEIFLELNPELLSKALHSLKPAQVLSLKIKLTNKVSPCLSCEVELASVGGNSRHIVHDIPVTVVPRRQWPGYTAPIPPEPNITLQAPALRLLRHISERMLSFCPVLELTVGQDGSFMLGAESQSVNVTTTFRELPVEQNLAGCADGNDNVVASVFVDIKSFAQFTACDQVGLMQVMCAVSDKQSVHMFLGDENIKMNFLLMNAGEY